MVNDAAEYLDHQGVKIAFRRSHGKSGKAGIVWMGGFHSDILGEKATTLHDALFWAAAGSSVLAAADYGRRFLRGVADLRRGIEDGPLVVVGSSMGGWMALLTALARPERIKALVLLAPAPDFTEKLMWASFDDSQKRSILEDGFWTRPSPYDAAGYPITRELIQEDRQWKVLDGEIALDIPVRILQGGLDTDVPWTHSLDLADKLRSSDVVWSLIKDGDHRLSRPQDIARMIATVLATADQVDATLSA